MSEQRLEPPQLTRTGGGRSARLAALLAVILISGSVALALADRASGPQPTSSPVAVLPTATPGDRASPSRSAPGPTPTHNAIGDDIPRLQPGEPGPGAFLLATLRGGDGPVVRHALAGPSELSAFIVVPPDMWQHEPVLELGWVGGEPARQHVLLAVVPLSIGSRTEVGLPVRQASGRLVLPAPVNGSSYWRYSVVIDRAHAYSNPHEWAVLVEVASIDGRRVCERKASAWLRAHC